MEKNSTPVEVVAAALLRADGLVLMQRRPRTAQHGGLWEFPGGKVEPGESRQAALIRELAEELGIVLTQAALQPTGRACGVAPPLVIHLYSCWQWQGEPIARAAEAIGWFPPHVLPALAMPPLDYPLARALISSI